MSQIDTARRMGLTPERATRMFLTLLAAALLVVALLSMESAPATPVGQADDGSTLVIEQTRSARAAQNQGNQGQGNSGSVNEQGRGSGKGNPGNACNNPVPAQKNPNCRPASPG